ncbi:hypothetical protein [Kocuria arenosa]|uniref:hypothetical protein n=1 Tax=Kocuria arenosa TaxID=3071446 RepID=UPI0034D6416A
MAESTVRALVAELRRETTDQCLQVKVPQTHAPAQEAEVDFGEFAAVIGGVPMKLWMFILHLSHSVRPGSRPTTPDPDRRHHSLLVSARTGHHNTEAIDGVWNASQNPPAARGSAFTRR